MKILIAGDFVPICRTAQLVEDSDFCFLEQVKPITETVDYAIVNYESPVLLHEARPILKVGPALKSNEKGIAAVKWAGFDCITLANNHFRDYGDVGVADTISAANKYSVDYVGGGRNLDEACKILYKDIKGETIAIINCCEHEFSIATEMGGGSFPLDPVRQYQSIQEAKRKAKIVLVIVHGGHEDYQLPSPRMKRLYRFFIEAGADAVINHHQHCYSGYEEYKGKPIFYGIGNFCFDRFRNKLPQTWCEGYLVILNFDQNGVSYELKPYKQCAENATVEMVPITSFSKKLRELNSIISNDIEINEHFRQFCQKNCRSLLLNILSPITNRYLLFLIRRFQLPSFVSSQKLLRTLSVINCESHRDLFIYILKDKLFNK